MADSESQQASSEGEERRRRLPSRSTRGKRLTELEGIDKDVDEEFWKLSMFAEDEGDNEFATTEQILEEEEDYEDSDMDDYTSDEEGEQQRAQNLEKKIAKEERETKKRKNVYKDDSKPKKKKSSSDKSSIEKLPKAPKTPKTIIPVEMKRSSRKSTVKATEATDEKIKAKTSKTKTKAPKELKKFTQEELLEEAKITVEENKKSLLKLRQTEEDVKKKARDSKSKNIDPNEPRVKYISKRGTNLIEFVNHDIPQCINQKMPDEEVKRFDIPKEEKQLKCVITGLPAKHIDPLTRKPYANIAAFKELRKMKIE